VTENEIGNRHDQESEEHAGTYPDSVPNEWARTLRVTVESDNHSDESATDHPTVSFPDVDTATAVFTDSTLALLRALNVHEPSIIRAADGWSTATRKTSMTNSASSLPTVSSSSSKRGTQNVRSSPMMRSSSTSLFHLIRRKTGLKNLLPPNHTSAFVSPSCS
jgi:hypothetical protein